MANVIRNSDPLDLGLFLLFLLLLLSSFSPPSPSFAFSSSLLPPATLVVLLGFHFVFLLSGWLSLDWCQIQGTNTVRRGRPPPVSLRDSLRFAYLLVLLMSVSAEPGAVGDKLKFHLKQIWAFINRLGLAPHGQY